MRFYTHQIYILKTSIRSISFKEQVDVLRLLTEMPINEKVDAMLITSEIYKRASPQSQTITVFHHL